MNTALRRGTSIAAAAALAGGLLLVAGSATAATGSVTTNTPFTASCHVRELDGAANPITFNETLGSGVTVTAPETVAPGETFTYRIQPNEMKTHSGGHSSRNVVHWARIKFDFDIPAGVEFVDAQLVSGSAYGLGSDSAAPSVTRIDDAGNPSTTGTHLRISGQNQTTGNAPGSEGRKSGGIIVGANTAFRLPAVDVTVRAGAAGTEIKPMLRVNDPGSANYDDAKNALTFVQREEDKTVFKVNYWERYNCSPRDKKDNGLNAGGQALTTVYVTQPTTTTVAAPSTIQASTPTDLVATVSPAPVTGNVQFRINGQNVGSPVAPGEDGTARLPHTFHTAGSYRVSAAFQGVNGFQSSTAEDATVNVTPAPVPKQTDTVVTVPSDAKTGAAVTLKAKVAPVPSGGTVQFKDGSTNIGVPVAVGTDGVAILEHRFGSAGTKNITAQYSGATGFAASIALQQPLIVSDPAPSDIETSTELSAPGTATRGALVELSATVAPSPGGGSVQFYDGKRLIGEPVAVGPDGVARMSYAFPAAGEHRITAVFNGRTGFGASTSPESLVTVTEPSGGGGDGGGEGTGSLGSLSIFGSLSRFGS